MVGAVVSKPTARNTTGSELSRAIPTSSRGEYTIFTRPVPVSEESVRPDAPGTFTRSPNVATTARPSVTRRMALFDVPGRGDADRAARAGNESHRSRQEGLDPLFPKLDGVRSAHLHDPDRAADPRGGGLDLRYEAPCQAALVAHPVEPASPDSSASFRKRSRRSSASARESVSIAYPAWMMTWSPG